MTEEEAKNQITFEYYLGIVLGSGVGVGKGVKNPSANKVTDGKTSTGTNNTADKNSTGKGKQPEDSIWSENKKGSSVDNAYGHWDKHKNEFPEFQNSKQYVDAAHDFMRNPPQGTLSKTRPNGDIVYYNPKTNIFAVKNAEGIPKTMFKPDPKSHGYSTNKEYYDAQ